MRNLNKLRGKFMNVQKVKAALYSVYMNASGYTVLRNPKGTPPTVVRSIRYHHGIDPETLDTFETYKRVTLDVAQPKKEKIHEYLFKDNFAFYNKETKKLDYKNQVQYSRYEAGKKDIHINKNWIENDILDKRDFKDIHKKKYSKKESVVDMSKAFLGYVSTRTVTVRKSLAEVEYEKYLDNMSKKREIQPNPSFLSTLFHNLKG